MLSPALSPFQSSPAPSCLQYHTRTYVTIGFTSPCGIGVSEIKMPAPLAIPFQSSSSAFSGPAPPPDFEERTDTDTSAVLQYCRATNNMVGGAACKSMPDDAICAASHALRPFSPVTVHRSSASCLSSDGNLAPRLHCVIRGAPATAAVLLLGSPANMLLHLCHAPCARCPTLQSNNASYRGGQAYLQCRPAATAAPARPRRPGFGATLPRPALCMASIGRWQCGKRIRAWCACKSLNFIMAFIVQMQLLIRCGQLSVATLDGHDAPSCSPHLEPLLVQHFERLENFGLGHERAPLRGGAQQLRGSVRPAGGGRGGCGACQKSTSRLSAN